MLDPLLKSNSLWHKFFQTVLVLFWRLCAMFVQSVVVNILWMLRPEQFVFYLYQSLYNLFDCICDSF